MKVAQIRLGDQKLLTLGKLRVLWTWFLWERWPWDCFGCLLGVKLYTSRYCAMMKFSRAISQVKWLSGEQTNVSKTISVLVLRVLV
jgi:hypothetical protein